MAATSVVKRATTLLDSDQAENNRLTQLMAAGWVINSAGLGSNATSVSFGTHAVIINGAMQVITTGVYTLAGTLATASTNWFGAFIYTRSVGATVSNAIAQFAATVGAIVFPSIP